MVDGATSKSRQALEASLDVSESGIHSGKSRRRKRLLWPIGERARLDSYVGSFPKGIESDPLYAGILTAFKSLQATALLDRLVWGWWLGIVPHTSTVVALARAARNRWQLPSAGQAVTEEKMGRIALQWADDRMPLLQTIIEAAPVEFGRSDPLGIIAAIETVSAAVGVGGDAIPLDAVSFHFHTLVTSLYEQADAQYVKARLYEDGIQSGEVPKFIEQTHAAGPFGESATVAQRHPNASHGVIVRVTQPISRRRDRSAKKSWWEGYVYYLRTAGK